MHIFEDINVDSNTYIVDGNKELQLADVSKRKGFWLLGYDRDGTCFEMSKISRATAKEIMFDYGNYSLKDFEIAEYSDSTYYWNEDSCDTGILLVH